MDPWVEWHPVLRNRILDQYKNYFFTSEEKDTKYNIDANAQISSDSEDEMLEDPEL